MRRRDRGIRHDYLLVWGHGIGYVEPIIEMVRANPALKIVKILNHVAGDIEELVHAVYSFDYAPLQHLKGKTRYLKQTPREVYFIFVENSSPDEDYFGEDAYRHIESLTVKLLKEEIRNRFNPRREDGTRSEDHVIHASDNQLQTDHILRYLGLPGLELFENRHFVLRAPYHLQGITEFSVMHLPLAELACSIVTGERRNFGMRLVGIRETPHYRALCGDCDPYRRYLATYLGTALTDDHSVDKLLVLRESFCYLSSPHQCDYILVKKREEGGFQVLDGVHRAAILAHQGVDAAHFAVV